MADNKETDPESQVHGRRSFRNSRKIINEDNLVEVDLLPEGDLGARIGVAGYGDAPRVVEVFADEDLDDVFEAADVQQIELNIEAESKQQVLNFDLSTEYQRPRLDRALEYRKVHMPTKSDGTLYSVWGAQTGRFIFKACSRIDPFKEGRKSDLIAFGPGISAYFKFLKSMSVLFFFLCVMSVPFLIINVNAGQYFNNFPIPFPQTTLGNLYITFNETAFLLANQSLAEGINTTVNAGDYTTYTLYLPSICPHGCTIRQTNLIIGYAIWDIVMCMVTLFTFNMLIYFTHHENRIYKEKILKIEDYSLETTVPPGADIRSLQEHFESLLQDVRSRVHSETNPLHEKFHQVYDVQIVESTGNSISLCIQRGRLLKELARLDARIKIMNQRGLPQNRIQRYQTRYEKTRERIHKLDQKAVNRAEKGKALMAFVTFETQEARLRVLHEYDVFWLCGREPEKLMFQGRELVRVKQSPPPTTLLWENQEISQVRRGFRLVLALLLLATILAISGGLSFATDSDRVFQTISNYAAGDLSYLCSGAYLNYTNLHEIAKLAAEQGNLQCFCSFEYAQVNATVSSSTAFLFATGGPCANYILSLLASIGKEIGLSIIISIISIAIFRVVIVVAHFVKFRNVLQREFAILRAIFYMTFLNTAVINLLVNVNWTAVLNTEVNNVVSGGTTWINFGSYSDFDPGWYSNPGVQMFLIGFFNIFAPHVLPLVRYLYHEFRRIYFAPYVISQQVLNEMYIGEEFLLSVRLAQTAAMFYFIVMFTPGMPIMYFLGWVSVIVSYWVDKFNFLRIVRTPPQFDTALQIWTIEMMEWALVLHCLFGFWMYGSPRVFPLTPREAEDSLFNRLDQTLHINPASNPQGDSTFNMVQEIDERIIRTECILMLLCAAFIILFKFVRQLAKTALQCASPAHVAMNMCRACLGKEHQLRKIQKHVLAADNFEASLKNGRIAGVRSYNILANPYYQRVLQMQPGFGKEEKPHDSVSESPEKDTISGSFKGFQSLQDALNIRKGTAISSIESRSMWKDDKSGGGSSLGTTSLYVGKDSDSVIGSKKSENLGKDDEDNKSTGESLVGSSVPSMREVNTSPSSVVAEAAAAKKEATVAAEKDVAAKEEPKVVPPEEASIAAAPATEEASGDV